MTFSGMYVKVHNLLDFYEVSHVKVVRQKSEVLYTIGKPQLENLCCDRAMETIYQCTYGYDKSHKIRQIIGIFNQIYTLCII